MLISEYMNISEFLQDNTFLICIHVLKIKEMLERRKLIKLQISSAWLEKAA